MSVCTLAAELTRKFHWLVWYVWGVVGFMFGLMVTILAVYEYTICKNEEDFMFVRKLITLLPKGLLERANLT